MNCWVVPAAMDGFAGVTATDANVGATTVNVVDPVTELVVAEIVVVPSATVVANPLLETAAIPGDDELQVDVVVRFLVLPSVYVPVAVNC